MQQEKKGSVAAGAAQASTRPAGPTEDVWSKHRALQKWFEDVGPVAVAYSGGVDSAFLLKVAHDVLGERCLAVIAYSASMPNQELEEALAIAKRIGARTDVIESRELDDPRYRQNGPERCLYCKGEVYDRIIAHAKEIGFTTIVDGTNDDDAADYRPGRQAALQRGVRSPLQELGITKQEVRALSRALDLPTWDKPAAPCLASRIPYGTPVSAELMNKIERAEAAVKSIGIRELRVRHHGDIARIEVGPADFETILAHRERIIGELKGIGYLYIALDMQGFRSGSLNERITQS
jgi:uncharacterized protein